MKQLISLGIIAEYNPFHLGHAYHIAKSREITGADCVIVVMSGNFLQRGEPAITDKYTRAEMALRNGADLVIELPVVSACSSAQYFAKGSIAILNALNVDHLCFGSESGEIAPLNDFILLLTEQESCLDQSIKELTASGISYPLARSRAVEQLLQNNNSSGISPLYDASASSKSFNNILSQPNNILGIEYLLELKKTHSSIVPHTIKRLGSNYNDTKLSGSFSSASAIRKELQSSDTVPVSALPENVAEILKKYQENHSFPEINDFTLLLKMKLLEMRYSPNNIADLPDYLLNKLIKSMEKCHSVTELIEAAKSKDLTYARINRALTHIILNITDADYKEFLDNPCPYIRILGLNDTGAAFLSSRKRNCQCPIITKPADYRDYLTKDIFASDVYNMILNQKSKQPVCNDFLHKIIKL